MGIALSLALVVAALVQLEAGSFTLALASSAFVLLALDFAPGAPIDSLTSPDPRPASSDAERPLVELFPPPSLRGSARAPAIVGAPPPRIVRARFGVQTALVEGFGEDLDPLACGVRPEVQHRVSGCDSPHRIILSARTKQRPGPTSTQTR